MEAKSALKPRPTLRRAAAIDGGRHDPPNGALDGPIVLRGARRGELDDDVVVVAETPKKHPRVLSQLPSTRNHSMRLTTRNSPSPPAAISRPPARRASSAGRTTCSSASVHPTTAGRAAEAAADSWGRAVQQLRGEVAQPV
ncbi:unnamed protein product, partial [Ectocarpus sp. 8 AP-2014]